MMQPDELMMSDIPWAVAWYGARPCVWLTPDDADTYKEMDKLKKVQAIFLTQRTSDRRFLSQMIAYERLNTNDWNRFYLDSLPTNLFVTVPVWAQGEVADRIPPHESHIRLRTGPNVHQRPKSLAGGPKKKMKKIAFSFDNLRRSN